jgi:hypothetical protein
MSFLLSDIESAVRQDLFDPAGASQRWATSDIDRAIDKAVFRYSEYYPNIVYSDMPSQPFQRTYPYPSSWNATYPVLWIERILYPLQVYGSYFTPPTSAPTAALASGTVLGVGSYQYLVTFLSQGGETSAGPSLTIVTTTNNQKVNLSNLPIGPSLTSTPGIATNTIIGRSLYRTQVGGSTFFYLATIGDNTSTTYSDSSPDTFLSGKPQPPVLNTSGVFYWPPLERNFAEYSNIYDSTASLAAGGNLGFQGAVGSAAGPTGSAEPTFTLMLNNADMPQDNTLVLRVFYATKHQLDSSGTTIPDIHRDVIVLGACTYCMEAYQIPTNDNFDLQDGALRDRLDDTKIPASWLAAIQNKRSQFESRLQEIKQARDYASSAVTHWGDVPRYWPRL